MNDRWFWKAWNVEYKLHLYFLTFVAVVSMAFFAWYHMQGLDSVLNWEHFQEQKKIETSVHSFFIGPFEVSVPADVYLLFEYFQGGKLQPNTWIAYFFVAVLVGAFVYLITIFSALERYWYLASSAVVILFLVSLRLDVLLVAGSDTNIFSISVIAVYLLSSFYFHAFNREAGFRSRLLVFSGLTLAIAVVVYFYASVSSPFLYLSVTGYVPALILTVLFASMVAHEIPVAFLYLTSHYLSARGLRHFLIAMVIYLLNLVLLYLSNLGIVTWDLVYLNTYVVFAISATIGLWGWRHRETLYGNVMPFTPFGAYFYLALCAVAFATLAFLMGNANDSALKVLSEIILFCHIGFGLVLLLYVFSNFLKVLDQNLSAWKVVYKPNRMPYETFRLGGLIIVISFMIYNGWRDYVNYSFSGFWNAMADLYVVKGKEKVAQLYYEQGRTYGFGSHHAHYAKGYYHSGEFQWAQSHENYQRATALAPSVYAATNDANVYNWEGSTFKGIFALKDALATTPGNPYLLNNLGFMNGKVHALDTALQLLNEARGYRETSSAAETNFAGFLSQERIPVSPDSIADLFSLEGPGVSANVLALSAITRMPLSREVNPFYDSVLTLHTAALLNNYLLARAFFVTSQELAKAEAIARHPGNEGYGEMLRSALAHAHYLQGNVSKALQLMSELSFVSPSHQGMYNFIIGLWMLEQSNPEGASEAFRYAVNYNFTEATFYLAIAETENRNLRESTYWWDSLRRSGDATQRHLAETFTPLFTLASRDVQTAADPIKYQYTRFRLSTRDSIEFNRVIELIENPHYKAQALLDMAARQLEADRLPLASKYINRALALPVTHKPLMNALVLARLRVLAAANELDELARLVTDIDFTLASRLDKLLYEGLLNDAAGNKEKAEAAFGQLATANPFFEEGVIAAADYARIRQKDTLRSYTIIAEAVQVNKTSVRLWKAYLADCERLGYDKYAEGARISLQQQLRR